MISVKVELGATLLTIATLVGVPIWIGVMNHRADQVDGVDDPHVITLTAVAESGIWTEDAVVGHNYWRRTPTEARPVVRVGENVVLILKTADVTHELTISDLDIGPVPIHPGYPVEVRFTPTEPGEYLMQCAARCGHCHEDMLGTIVVLGPGQTLADYQTTIRPPRSKCPLKSAN